MVFPVPTVSTLYWTPQDWEVWIAAKGVPSKKVHGGTCCDCPTCCKARGILALKSLWFTDAEFHQTVKNIEAQA